jgi:hypothetical protein
VADVATDAAYLPRIRAGSRRGLEAKMLGRMKVWIERCKEARRERLMVERRIDVTTDDVGIRVEDGRGNLQSMAWSEVESIAIETNDRGPWETRRLVGAWGPYLSERQWGTVREDYSADR